MLQQKRVSNDDRCRNKLLGLFSLFFEKEEEATFPDDDFF